ncbi:BREX-3 system phosphatase PglZ [Kroppenstedtia eburnea]|uniref:BREX-3 system phosphatase PglZ n=1 Tax=Kroppenstedtia eburnea TaxID=714067 RepID=UPI003628275D
MSSWRDRILQHFDEPLLRLYLVSDPDDLLLDEEILIQLQIRGLTLIPYEDPVTFRYQYESSCRERLQNLSSHILLRVKEDSVDHLPYDLLKAGDRVDLRLSSLFPRFSANILSELDAGQLDRLHVIDEEYTGPPSDSATCDFIMRKVLKVPYDTIDNPVDLMKHLFVKHSQGIRYPKVLEQFLLRNLRLRPELERLPLEEIVPSSRAFFDYIQGEWSACLKKWSVEEEQGKEALPPEQQYGFEMEMFCHPEVWPFVEHLFMEGKLSRVKGIVADRLPEWTHVGIHIDSVAEEKQGLNHLLERLEGEDVRSDHKGWSHRAMLFGRLKHLRLKLLSELDDETNRRIATLEKKLDTAFADWMFQGYQALPNLPHLPVPVMVHHIPHYLDYQRRSKVALLVVDGMSFVQWNQIREALESEFHMEERGVFAWVPTITSISRQAIFTGEPPLLFSQTLSTTRKEVSAWKLFWENHQVSRMRVSYEKGLGLGMYDSTRIQALQKGHTLIAGLVVDTIDRLMHGAIQGQKGIYEEIDLWLKRGYLKALIHDLLARGFDLFLTSDHGNEESCGIGRISEGVLAHSRGERVRIYSDESLRDRAAQVHPSYAWPGFGLPQGSFALLARGGEAFIPEKEMAVSHGGISLEEVIVPFVHVTRKSE